MNHLHFTQSLEPLNGGGLGTSAVGLHREFLARGVPSVLCSTHGGRPQRPAEATFEFRRLKPDFIYFSPAMMRKAAGLVNETDLLHGHGLYTGTNFIFGREARRQRKPLVYHVHGMFEPYILQRSRWKKTLVHWFFEDDNIRQVRLWRALTNKEADQIRSCGLDAPVVVVPNGLNLSDYLTPGNQSAPIETPVGKLKKNRLRVLFLARIHPKKGLDLLLPAWTRLGTTREDWELVIAGPDEGGYMDDMKHRATTLGIAADTVFTGAITGGAKNALLHSADLFVLPSYSEGFSMGLLEAMACRVPVIATHACNCPDITRVGSGWECEATVDSLVATLRTAVRASDQERQQRGDNGRRLIENQYHWSHIVATLVQACAAHC